MLKNRFAGRALMALVVAVGSLFSGAAHAQSFIKSSLNGATLDAPTALQFGPDGRLYVTERYGLIRIFTINRAGSSSYSVVDTETISQIQSTTNHNDDGTVNTGQNTRQTTGMFVAGTPGNPVIYVTHSDPRTAVGSDSGLDTNSGTLSRLTWNGSSWDRLDLVLGLPRNEENHSTNGLYLDEFTNTIYIAQGGNTNMGAPSNNFAFQPEYALSAAILSVDLNAIGESTYELPTLNDPSRADEQRLLNGVLTTVDVNDPYGGNNGNNQAVIVPGGPVQVFAPGFRNAYDVCLTADGRMYTIDNGPNGSWGGPPLSCSLTPNDNESRSYNDNLHYIGNVNSYVPGSYYGGHPNPTRADRGNTFAGGQTPIPVGMENAIECIYQRPYGATNPPAAPHDQLDSSLWSWNSSTNGMCEYTASNFGGTMQGDLLAATYNGQSIERIQLNAPGDNITTASTLFANVGGNQLDVTAQGDLDVFPGTIWAAGFAQDRITVFEPDDFSVCTGLYDNLLDEDGDGFSNADEIDNGTDPCSNGSVPADNDNDGLSDLNDSDDDNDGLPDEVDAFAIDPFNGLTTALPVAYEWGVGEPGFGLLGLGFTGMLTNGVDNYLDQFTPDEMTPGGAAGIFTIDVIDEGDAYQSNNTQRNGFQFGVNVTQATGTFEVSTAIAAPYFGGVTPADYQSLGLQIGAGDQDNLAKLVMNANGGAGGIEFQFENAGTASGQTFGDADYGATILSATSVELILTVDPAAGTVAASVSLSGAPRVSLGTPIALTGAVLDRVQGPEALAVGLISTSYNSGAPFAGSWDYLRVTPVASTASAVVRIDPAGNGIDNSTYNNGSFQITNTSTGGQLITDVAIDLGSVVFPDMVFDPDGTAGDATAKGFTVNSDGGTSVSGHSFGGPHNGVDGDDGYEVLGVSFASFDPAETMTFSIDNDPTSIKGGTAPGPNESGSISGSELTGATVTVTFSDGTVLTGQTSFVSGTLDASEAVVATAPAPAPSLLAVGVGTGAATVVSPNQTVRITGPAGASGELMHASGGLYVNGNTGSYPNGYDIDPFETNSLSFVSAIPFTIGAGGTVDVPVTLTRFEGDAGYTPGPADQLGHNTFAAALDDGTGRLGLVSAPVLMQLVEADLSFSSSSITFGNVLVGDVATAALTLTNTSNAPIDITSLSVTGNPPFGINTPPSLPATIAPGASLDLTVHFAPESTGSESGSIEIQHTGNNSPQLVTLTGTGVFETGDVLFRINTGGPQVAAIDSGPDWAADSSSTPSPYLVAGGDNTAAFSVTPGATVPATTPATVFQTERWDPSAAPEMQWEFPVGSDQTVEVRLYLGNGYSGTSGAGARVFSVNIEGANAFGSIDLSGDLGHQVGAMFSYNATVGADGVLDIDFVHNVENPLINAIEILGQSESFTLSAQSGLVSVEADSGSPLATGSNTMLASDGSAQTVSLAAVDDATGLAPTWLTLPATVTTGTPFNLNADASLLSTGIYTATITASATGTDPVEFSLTLTVNGGVNSAPIAIDDSFNANDGAATDLDVLANDTDDGFPANPALTAVTIDSTPAQGTATVNPEGTVRYTYTGPTLTSDTTDSFTYTLADSGGLTSAPATVTLTVSPYVSDASALMLVNDNEPIDASTSTYTANAFQLSNTSPGGQLIEFIEIDLSTAAILDLVFDPDGKAGDAVGKPLVIDTDPGVGTVTSQFLDFNNGVNDDDGFNRLRIDFTDFGPGETLGFSTDIDPNSIKGFNGSGLAGSVMGLELVGANVKIGFSDGTVRQGRLYGNGLDGDASVLLQKDEPPTPTLELLGGMGLDHINVSQNMQTFRVHAPEGTSVRLLRFEAILSPQGINGGLGYEVELFEANTLPGVALTSESTGVTGPEGYVDLTEFILSSAVAADETPGYNHLIAVAQAGGQLGDTSNALIVRIGNNLPPIAMDDTLQLPAGATNTVLVTDNDMDVDGFINTATVTILTPPAIGTIDSIDPVTGEITYTAAATGTASDSFTYTVRDNAGSTSNEATVDITIGCPIDLNGDGIADNGDIIEYVQLYLAGDPAADFNNDGILDNGDIGAFVAAFLAGC